LISKQISKIISRKEQMWRENRLHERYESEVKLKLEHKDELNDINDSSNDLKDDERSMSDDYDYGYTQQENNERLHDYQPNKEENEEYIDHEYNPNQGKN
jgi:hypothetical protein